MASPMPRAFISTSRSTISPGREIALLSAIPQSPGRMNIAARERPASCATARARRALARTRATEGVDRRRAGGAGAAPTRSHAPARRHAPARHAASGAALRSARARRLGCGRCRRAIRASTRRSIWRMRAGRRCGWPGAIFRHFARRRRTAGRGHGGASAATTPCSPTSAPPTIATAGRARSISPACSVRPAPR